MRALRTRLSLRRSKKGKEPAETPLVAGPPAEKLPTIPEVKLAGNDITVPVAVTPPGSQFSQRVHPLKPVGFGAVDLGKPIETNKWWGTLEVAGAQHGNCFAFPYTLWWSNNGPFGMNISHTEASQLVFDPSNTPPQYYINPLGICSISIGAQEFNASMTMGIDTPTQFTINVTLSSGSGSIKFPFVEGMAFTTAIYSGVTPLLTSAHAIILFQSSTISGGSKYKVGLNDGTTWLIYVFASSGSYSLTQNGNNIVGNGQFNGYLQVAKIPTGNTTAETTYDAQAGTYVTTMTLYGATSGSTGTYGFQFGTAGKSSSSVLHFALPHHQASFDTTTQGTATGIYLQSTTMGVMRAYTATQWTMTETLPSNIAFLSGNNVTYTESQLSAIVAAAANDINYDVGTITATCSSQYFAGKYFAKYAEICLVANDILKNNSLAATGIAKLKAAFATFQSNQQAVPLCYDTAWKGMVSTAGMSGDAGSDFGNTFYNDHHFHYGYFIYAAAVLGHLDPTWLTQANVDYINSLIRDVANPSSQDPYFPVFRMFDWFCGHSWAAGLFFFGDGKNEESTSEDYNFSYGLKLWGMVTNNLNSQARGDLMCAVQKR
jgi:endo-1,3(4)-beta-glucanase